MEPVREEGATALPLLSGAVEAPVPDELPEELPDELPDGVPEEPADSFPLESCD